MSAVLAPVAQAVAAEHVVVFVAPPEAVSVLRAVLTAMPVEFPAAFLILLHAGDGHERPVADNLNVNSTLMVVPAVEGGLLRTGHAYVALPAQNLAIGSDGRLVAAEGDDLLASVAAAYGSRAVVVALTLLLPEESEGFLKVRAAGGYTIALDEADRLWTKPAGPRVVPAPADELLPADQIGPRMLAMLLPSSMPSSSEHHG